MRPRGYWGLPAFASLSMAGSAGIFSRWRFQGAAFVRDFHVELQRRERKRRLKQQKAKEFPVVHCRCGQNEKATSLAAGRPRVINPDQLKGAPSDSGLASPEYSWTREAEPMGVLPEAASASKISISFCCVICM